MSGPPAPRRFRARRALALVGTASVLWSALAFVATASTLWSAHATARPAPTVASPADTTAAVVAADLDRVKRFIELIEQKKLFIQKEGDGLGMVTLEQLDADVQAKEVDLELDDSPQAREAAARTHAENLQNEVNRRYGQTRSYLPILEQQRKELEERLAKLGGAPATTPTTTTPTTTTPTTTTPTTTTPTATTSSLAAFRGGLRGSWEITCYRGAQRLEFKNGGRWYMEFPGDGTISGRFEDYHGTPRPARGRIDDKGETSGETSGESGNVRWSGTFERDGNSLALVDGRGSVTYVQAVFDAEPGLECSGRWRKD